MRNTMIREANAQLAIDNAYVGKAAHQWGAMGHGSDGPSHSS